MKIYFLSSIPCALTVNGAYFGVTDGFERSAELALRDGLFIKFSPENALPISFFLTEDIRFHAPKGCQVYLLRDGIAIYAREFPPCDFALQTIAQKREGETLATVFRQGEVQLSIQTANECQTAVLPREFGACELAFHEGSLFVQNEKSLAVFTAQGERVFYERILSFTVENGRLTAILPLLDSLGRKAECVYALSSAGLERVCIKLIQERALFEDARAELLPYAFFECVLLGAEYTEFLHADLKEKAEDLRAFLGEFIDIVITQNPVVCGLVRKKTDGIFAVDYYTVEICEGKIVDIQG